MLSLSIDYMANSAIMEQQLQLNEHNKQEYPPMHTVEHAEFNLQMQQNSD